MELEELKVVWSLKCRYDTITKPEKSLSSV